MGNPEFWAWYVTGMVFLLTFLAAMIPTIIADKMHHPQLVGIRVTCIAAYATWYMFGIHPVPAVIWAAAWIWTFTKQKAAHG